MGKLAKKTTPKNPSPSKNTQSGEGKCKWCGREFKDLSRHKCKKKPSKPPATTSDVFKTLPSGKSPSVEIPKKRKLRPEILLESPYLSLADSIQLREEPLEEIFIRNALRSENEEVKLVMTGQYRKAIEMLLDADATGLFPVFVGPPGTGKTTLCRYYAQMRGNLTGNDTFEWMTFDESTKPVHLIGGFNPAVVINKGFIFEAYSPGPLVTAMLRGGIFLANEINRATEYTQNSLLEPLEELSVGVPHLGRVRASPGFFFVGAMNPSEIAGTHRLSEALKDRLKVWINLDYPDKRTEMEIIRINNPHYAVPEALLDQIYVIIQSTRKDPQIEVPASLRSGIAIARLVGIQLKEADGIDDHRALRGAARAVLEGAIKPKPGVKPEVLVKKLLARVL